MTIEEAARRYFRLNRDYMYPGGFVGAHRFKDFVELGEALGEPLESQPRIEHELNLCPNQDESEKEGALEGLGEREPHGN